jgi:hypothetical protein
MFAALLTALAWSAPGAIAADPCTPITAVPTVITAPGTYCVIGYLVTSQLTGAAIEIQSDDVTLDITQGGLDAGGYENRDNTTAGVYALDRNNISVVGGVINFFAYGILLENSAPDFANTRGHRVSGVVVQVAQRVGIEVRGMDTAVTNSSVLSTGWTGTYGLGSVAAIMAWGPRAVVSGNNLVSNETRGAGSSATAIQIYGSSNCEANDNRIVNTSTAAPGGGLSVAILVSNSTDCTVRGNEIDNRTTFPLGIGVYMPDSDHIQAATNKMTHVSRHYAR